MFFGSCPIRTSPGRRNRDRTCDLCLVRAALFQLSYPPDFPSKLADATKSISPCQPILALFLQILRVFSGAFLMMAWSSDVPAVGRISRALLSTVLVRHACRFVSSQCRHAPAWSAQTEGLHRRPANGSRRNAVTCEEKSVSSSRPAGLASGAPSRTPAS